MNDMERIQQGLEEFLQRQMQEETKEKEIDIISTGRVSKDRNNYKNYNNYEDYDEFDEYDEDWDIRKRSSRRSSRQNSAPSRRSRGSQSTKRRSKSGRRVESGEYSRTDYREKSDRQTKKKARKKNSKLKVFLFRAVMLIFFLAAGLYFVVAAAYSKLNYHEIESLTSKPMKEDGVINILLIGNDSRQNGEDGRSDAMILLSICPKKNKIYMTSLLRDMYVEISGHDDNRLNAAYSFGGSELLMKTVEENLDIKINRYMLVNFEAFANLVDAVGGVDLELSSAEIEWVNAYLNEYNLLTEKEFGTDYMDTSKDGMVHLNGPQALAYTRNRYIGTDFGRTERQRKVLKEVVRSLPKGMLHPIKLTDGLMPNLTTNLTQWECYRLSLMAPLLLTYDIEQGSIPVEGTYRDATIRKMAVLEVDFEANKEYLHKLLFEPDEKEEDVER